MKITRTSPISGEHTIDLDVTPEQMAEWNGPRSQRRCIQDIFPDLTKDQREFIQTGYTAEDWRAMFPPMKDCPTCEGTGESEDEPCTDCPTCEGTGEVPDEGK